MSTEGRDRLTKEQLERADALAAEALSLLAHADQAARKGPMESPASLPPMAGPETAAQPAPEPGDNRHPDDDQESTVVLPQDGELPAVSTFPMGEAEGPSRYVVRGVVGRGGMGEVLLCFDPHTRRQIALKRMLPSTAEDDVLRTRFVAEAQVTAQLEHPNIVPVYELAKGEQGHAYYTMRLVKGRPLSSILDALRSAAETLSLVELVQIFLKVCDAVGFAHARGVIHRDLKPGNVMVGSFGEVLVVDWGLAKIVGRPDLRAGDLVTSSRVESGIEVTVAGDRMGTPAYMPPEQARGEIGEIDERSDIYSLGALLYEMLTLERPVEGATLRSILDKVANGDIVPPERRAPARQIPRELSEIAMKCLARRREDRYQSVAELRTEAGLFLEGREAWLPVCSLDFRDGRLDERFEAVHQEGPETPGKCEWVSNVERVAVRAGELRVEPAWSGASALHWREEIGEEARVAVTLLNEPHSLPRISVSGDTESGYRFLFYPTVPLILLDTIANGYWETLAQGLIPLDLTRPSWDIVVERSGQWVRAWVDGKLALEYYDPLPLSGPGHRTFGLSVRGAGFTITRLRVWKRRSPESVSVLETGRYLLQSQRYAEAADFLAGQIATPRGTPLDDEAEFLYALCQENLGASDAALASYLKAGDSTNRWLAAMAHLRVARLLIARGDLAGAGRAARCARLAAPSIPAADHLRRALADITRSPDPPCLPSADVEGITALAETIDRKMTSLWGAQSLEPLRALPLTYLDCGNSQIRSLAPLAGMPLECLNVGDCPEVSDLSPLRGMPLKELLCGATNVRDLTPLQGMPLMKLNCGPLVTNLTPLRGMPLKDLSCAGSPVSDLSPLEGAKLERLVFWKTRVRDLRCLKGMPLKHLNFQETQVSDLSPLKGMPLEELWISGTPVSDLSPLAGMSLRTLMLDTCENVTDLTPLEGMKLETVAFIPRFITSGIEILRRMNSVTGIGDHRDRLTSPEVFWRKYDAGEFK